MKKLYLWNDRKKQMIVADCDLQQESTAFPFFVDHDGIRYHSSYACPSYYFTPPTEEAMLNMLSDVWQHGSPLQHLVENAPLSPVQHTQDLPQNLPQNLLDQRSSFANSLEDALYPVEPLVQLRDDVVGLHEGYSYRGFLHGHLLREIQSLPERPLRILEVGSGEGPNLFYLKKEFPEAQIVGIEISNLCEVARRGAAHFSLDMEVIQANATADLSMFPDRSFDLVFVHGVLHALKDHYERAFQNMIRLTRKWIFLYEPFPELWEPNTGRTWASLIYFNSCSYVTGFFKRLSQGGFKTPSPYRIIEAGRLKHCMNPLNETCFVKVSVG